MPVRYLSDSELARLSSWPGKLNVADAATLPRGLSHFAPLIHTPLR